MMDRNHTVTSSALRLLVATLPLALLAAPAAAVPVEASLGIDNDSLAGTDGAGRVLLYAPNPVESGSSISHWDSSATPDLLMEPANSPALPFGGLDLTRAQMFDIGWQPGTSNVVIRVDDEAGQGFNDPALGATRMAAIQFAAGLWANALRSSVTINVSVSFDALPCSNGSGVLAQAGPNFVFESFPGAPVGNTLYPGALAEAISGQNLSLQDVSNPNAGDLGLTFNSNIDTGCLGGGSRYYYGLDGNEPVGTINFVMVALHEMGHGLGFASFVNEVNGSQLLGRPDIYSRNIRDNTSGLNWHQMTNAQRQTSAVNSGNVVWSGGNATNQAPNFLQPAPALTINEPASIAGRYQITTALFGPPLGNQPITGEIAVAVDGSATPNLACSPIVNGGDVAGRIALIDRGTCNFTVKVANAQAVGARAVIIVNNQPGSPIPLGGTDGSITIPSVMVSMADGQRFKDALAEQPPMDQPGRFAVGAAAVTVSEGDGAVSLTISRDGGSAGSVSVDYATGGGTATAGQDYTATSGTVTFADGETGTRSVEVAILDDDAPESAETFEFTLSNPQGGASLGSTTSTTVTIADDEPCVQDASTACLNRGRFKVNVTWRDFQGNTGVASRVEVPSEDSALLWFFGATNWEMLIKVLDGCPVNDRFWVFAGATTNVEYNLIVTDTQTGQVREYVNDLGVSAPAVTDTDAFATCP